MEHNWTWVQFTTIPEASISVNRNTETKTVQVHSRCTIEVSVANLVSRTRTAWSFHPSKFLRELLISQSLKVVPAVCGSPDSFYAKFVLGNSQAAHSPAAGVPVRALQPHLVP